MNTTILILVILGIIFLIMGVLFAVVLTEWDYSRLLCRIFLFLCLLCFFNAFVEKLEVERNLYKVEYEQRIEETKNYTVYINGVETDREYIDIMKYTNITFDDENKRILITVN